jgi:hypothetical protein
MLAYFFIFLGAVLRLLPHPANFAPIAAIALFGGVHLGRRWSLVVPLLALVLSDFFIGFDSLTSRITVYGSFIIIGVIGLWLRQHRGFANTLMAAISGSVIFYLITNFAFFYPPVMYTHNWTGVVSSYINALPFFRNTLLGDLFYTGVFFGAYAFVLHFAQKRRPGILTSETK